MNIGDVLEKILLIGLLITSLIGAGVVGTMAMGDNIGMMRMGGGMRNSRGGGCPMMNGEGRNYMHDECREHMEEHCGNMSWEECEEMHEECEEHMHEYCEHEDERVENIET